MVKWFALVRRQVCLFYKSTFIFTKGTEEFTKTYTF